MSGAFPKPNHILVAVATSAGTFPPEGYDEVPDHQPVKVELQRAAKELGISNTTGWIATVGGHVINVDQSYQQNGLSGTIMILWGPPERGGGRR